MNVLAAAIRAGRAALGWSQQALADRAGTSLPTVARIEASMSSPKLETISRLIGALETAGIDFDWLYPGGFGMKVKLGERKPVGEA